MEAQITEFIHSDGGGLFAIALIVIGICDLGVGYYITRYKPHLLPIPAEKLKAIMTKLYFVASFFVLIGLYMLYLRA